MCRVRLLLTLFSYQFYQLNDNEIIVIFDVDEEIGGDNGMRLFVKTEAFRRLNVGFALDEGIATPDEVFSVFYAERSVWRVDFVCHGTTGHGSLLLENTAGEKLRHILDRMMNFREEQQKILKNNPEFSIGDVTTVNLTIINGGVQSNVVPPSLTALFDVRIAVDVDHDAFEEMVISEYHEFFNKNSMIYVAFIEQFSVVSFPVANLVQRSWRRY